jgi:3-phosphoshikimate 1-carboxyvinyltransferase
MREIKPRKIVTAEVIVPGSKSYTHRILIASALSDGRCTISNALKSEDTLLTLNALRQLGMNITEDDTHITIHGSCGRLTACDTPIFLGNSGTSMRLLAGVASLADGVSTLTGTSRMCERPIQDLLDGLNQTGIAARSINNSGCPPIEINGGMIRGGSVKLRCGISSQYLSALLLIAPYTENGLDINVIEGPVSKPYIDMTIGVMRTFGVEVSREGYNHFHIRGNQCYHAGNYTVEPDCSNASYFWAAAAITGGTVRVRGITRQSGQGDIRLLELFEQMGCKVIEENNGIAVSGEKLKAIEADMADMPDMVPTLAVVAAYTDGTTIIKNVAHLKAKESDRLNAVATELSKMGIEASCHDTGLIIKGGTPHGATIHTYNDHRIAMCFAVAGLITPGLRIENESCVEKSFPNFWDVFEAM